MTFRGRVLGVRMTEPMEQEQEKEGSCPRAITIPPIHESIASTDPKDYKTVTQR